MQIVILAGGLGTRLKSVTGSLPKALVPVAGRPFIDRQLDLLAKDFSQAVYCLGYGADEIIGHFNRHPRVDIEVLFSLEDPDRLLGTGGAILHALERLDDRFFVVYGDSFLPTDYGKAVEHFRTCGCPAMMCVHRNKGQWDRSNVDIRGGKVVYYDKRAEPGTVDYIDYGLTAYRREVFERYREVPAPLDLAVILADLVRSGELSACEVAERFYEVGKPEGLRELEDLLKCGKGRGQ